MIVKQIIFFILLYVLFYLSIKTFQGWSGENEYKLPIISAVYTVIAIVFFYSIKIKEKENFVNAAVCRGGSYMFQGDDPTAKMCRDLEKSKEGRAMIAQYNCGRGFVGKPRNNFSYSSNSNSEWEGIPCNDDNAYSDEF